MFELRMCLQMKKIFYALRFIVQVELKLKYLILLQPDVCPDIQPSTRGGNYRAFGME